MIALLDYLLVTLCGWTKPFSGANIAVYKQPVGSNGFYLRVDDTHASYAQVRGFETMSDVNTGTGPFPTDSQVSEGLYMHHADAAGYPWKFASNGKIFWLNWQFNSYTYCHDLLFGDFVSFKPGDIYNTLIQCSEYSTSTSPSYVNRISSTAIDGSNYHMYFARSFSQIGGSVSGIKYTDSGHGGVTSDSYIGTTGLIYPSQADGTLRLAPLWLAERNPHNSFHNAIRGYIPGFWCPLHPRPLGNYDVFNGTSGIINGRAFEVWDQPINISSTRWQMFIETSDTWGGL